nr:unnamed protein product [Callosobruchus chinensis]
MIATEFSQWCARNSLVINPDKTVMMCFGNRCRHSLQISVLVDGIIIDESPVAEFLGTTIDRDLRWSNNIAKICNKINQSYYALLQVKKYLNLNQIINVYYAIIHSHLSYNVVLWGASPSVDRVFVAQKRALRLIFGLTYRESCRQTFHRYKIMPVPCIYIYKCIMYIKSNLHLTTKNNHHHSYLTRGGDLLRSDKHHTSLYERSPYYMGTKLYNSLPAAIRNEVLKNRFGKKLKSFLVDNCFYSIKEYFEFNGSLQTK